jgi:hypothetical protein
MLETRFNIENNEFTRLLKYSSEKTIKIENDYKQLLDLEKNKIITLQEKNVQLLESLALLKESHAKYLQNKKNFNKNDENSVEEMVELKKNLKTEKNRVFLIEAKYAILLKNFEKNKEFYESKIDEIEIKNEKFQKNNFDFSSPRFNFSVIIFNYYLLLL